MTQICPDSANLNILLIGENWQAQALAEYLKTKHPRWNLDQNNELNTGRDKFTKSFTKKDLICWLIPDSLSAAGLEYELKFLQLRHPGSEIILLIQNSKNYQKDFLLKLRTSGLLEQPNLHEIDNAIEVIAKGGRVFKINDNYQTPKSTQSNPGGGCNQIDSEIIIIQHYLERNNPSNLIRFILNGRIRELRMARKILKLIWGSHSEASINSDINAGQSKEELKIILSQRSGVDVLSEVKNKLTEACTGILKAEPEHLLALEALLPEKRKILLISLLNEFGELVKKLNSLNTNSLKSLPDLWISQQVQLRQRALLEMIGAYTQLPKEGELIPLANELLKTADFSLEDSEIYSLCPILSALLESKPLVINGQLMAADQPYALLHLQTLLSNWMLRNAERIATELLEACSNWPELRRTMLPIQLLPTRELDRLRNRLNSIERWQNNFIKPIAIYESKRMIYSIKAGRICSEVIIEPRDNELKSLSWWQQAITVILEARDALAPQLEILINRLGSFMVLLLTRVLGRAIGLVGRGIIQGLGKGIQNSTPQQ
jgi:hypothetical protein